MHHRVLLMCSCLLAACASTRATHQGEPATSADAGVASPADQQAARQADLEAMFRRESEPSPAVTVTVRERPITLESSAPVVVTRNDTNKAIRLSVGLKASTPMSCYLFDERLRTGVAFSQMLTNLKAAKLEVKGIRPRGVELIENVPAVFLELDYQANGAQGLLVGQAKLMLYDSPVAPLYCLFDEPGYAQAFRRAATSAASGLVRSLGTLPSAPTFRTVSITRVRDVPVGFNEEGWWKAKDGSRTITTTSLMLAPRTPTDWFAEDHESLATLAKDDTLNEKRFLSHNNGEVDRELTLTRVKGNTYRYAGTSQGKALEGTFKSQDKKGLWSNTLVARRIKAFVAGRDQELTYEEYIPELNPAALTEVTVTRGTAPGEVTMAVGPMKLDVVVDASGVPQRTSVAMGPVTLIDERAHSEGAVE